MTAIPTSLHNSAPSGADTTPNACRSRTHGHRAHVFAAGPHNARTPDRRPTPLPSAHHKIRDWADDRQVTGCCRRGPRKERAAEAVSTWPSADPPLLANPSITTTALRPDTTLRQEWMLHRRERREQGRRRRNLDVRNRIGEGRKALLLAVFSRLKGACSTGEDR